LELIGNLAFERGTSSFVPPRKTNLPHITAST